MLGRFIQPDRTLDGLNRYTYCHNNPVRYVDPSGSITQEEGMAKAKEAQQKNSTGGSGNGSPKWGPGQSDGWHWDSKPSYIKGSSADSKTLNGYDYWSVTHPSSATTVTVTGEATATKLPGTPQQPPIKTDEKPAPDEVLSTILREAVGTKYDTDHRDPSMTTGMDCTGVLVYALRQMGYRKVPRFRIWDIIHGKVDFVRFYDDVDSSIQGVEGVLNFYDWGKGIVHVNVGVGMRGDEQQEQVIDATETAWMMARNPESAQKPKAGSGQVNQTFIPYSRQRGPTKQAWIDWTALEKYKGDPE